MNENQSYQSKQNGMKQNELKTKVFTSVIESVVVTYLQYASSYAEQIPLSFGLFVVPLFPTIRSDGDL